ncbi:hypothetical protein ABZW49_20360 [Nonomuraea wenchangensis]
MIEGEDVRMHRADDAPADDAAAAAERVDQAEHMDLAASLLQTQTEAAVSGLREQLDRLRRLSAGQDPRPGAQDTATEPPGWPVSQE